MNPISIVISIFLLLLLTLVLYRWKKSIDASWIRLFEKEYSETLAMVDNCLVSRFNFKFIEMRIETLEANPYRDIEQMDVLKRRFYSRFAAQKEFEFVHLRPKKWPILATVFILLLTLPLSGQNIISGLYARGDNGLGLRYDRQIKIYNKYGFYVGATKGMYAHRYYGNTSHEKIMAGFSRYAINYAEPDWLVCFTIGANYNRYKQITKGLYPVSKQGLWHWSGDLGVLFIIDKRLTIGWTWDVIKSDTEFAAGYRFGIK